MIDHTFTVKADRTIERTDHKPLISKTKDVDRLIFTFESEEWLNPEVDGVRDTIFFFCTNGTTYGSTIRDKDDYGNPIVIERDKDTQKIVFTIMAPWQSIYQEGNFFVGFAKYSGTKKYCTAFSSNGIPIVKNAGMDETDIFEDPTDDMLIKVKNFFKTYPPEVIEGMAADAKAAMEYARAANENTEALGKRLTDDEDQLLDLNHAVFGLKENKDDDYYTTLGLVDWAHNGGKQADNDGNIKELVSVDKQLETLHNETATLDKGLSRETAAREYNDKTLQGNIDIQRDRITALDERVTKLDPSGLSDRMDKVEDDVAEVKKSSFSSVGNGLKVETTDTGKKLIRDWVGTDHTVDGSTEEKAGLFVAGIENTEENDFSQGSFVSGWKNVNKGNNSFIAGYANQNEFPNTTMFGASNTFTKAKSYYREDMEQPFDSWNTNPRGGFMYGGNFFAGQGHEYTNKGDNQGFPENAFLLGEGTKILGQVECSLIGGYYNILGAKTYSKAFDNPNLHTKSDSGECLSDVRAAFMWGNNNQAVSFDAVIGSQNQLRTYGRTYVVGRDNKIWLNADATILGEGHNLIDQVNLIGPKVGDTGITLAGYYSSAEKYTSKSDTWSRKVFKYGIGTYSKPKDGMWLTYDGGFYALNSLGISETAINESELKKLKAMAAEDYLTQSDLDTTVKTLATKEEQAALTSRVSAAETSIANLEKGLTSNLKIGGRNLLLNSREAICQTPDSYGTDFEVNVPDLLLGEGQYMIASATVEMTDFVFNGRAGFELNYKDKTGGLRYLGVWTNTCIKSDSVNDGLSVNNLRERIVRLMGPVSNMGSAEEIEGKPMIQGGISGSCKIYDCKLEVGNIATDWTPAPEDLEALATTAQSTADTAKSAADTAKTTADKATTAAANAAKTATDYISVEDDTGKDPGYTVFKKSSDQMAFLTGEAAKIKLPGSEVDNLYLTQKKADIENLVYKDAYHWQSHFAVYETSADSVVTGAEQKVMLDSFSKTGVNGHSVGLFNEFNNTTGNSSTALLMNGMYGVNVWSLGNANTAKDEMGITIGDSAYPSFQTRIFSGAPLGYTSVGMYMSASHNVSWPVPIEQWHHGVVFIWTNYEGGVVNRNAANHFFLSKDFIQGLLIGDSESNNDGGGTNFLLGRFNDGSVGNKYVYLRSTGFWGHDKNHQSYKDSNSGITFDNNRFVLDSVVVY